VAVGELGVRSLRATVGRLDGAEHRILELLGLTSSSSS